MVIVAVIGAEVALVAVKLGILPVPLAAKPMAVFEFVHETVPPVGVVASGILATVVEAHAVTFAGGVIVGGAFTTIVATSTFVHPDVDVPTKDTK